MNEQSTPTSGTATDESRPSAGRPGPRVDGEQMRDVDRLRRSGTDRYVAGVAGGLGRHFDIDPTIVRVLLAVLTFFGGAGVLVYAAVWLFVPEDGADRAPVDVGADVRRIILVVVAAVGLMIVFGSPFFGDSWGFPLPLVLIGLIVLAVVGTRRQRRGSPAPPPAPWGSSVGPGSSSTPSYAAPSYAAPTYSTPSYSAASPSQEGPTMSTSTPGTADTTSTTPVGDDEGDTLVQQPPTWMPPSRPPYVPPPPRPRRTGLVLFWPTLALIAIGLGTLGILDTNASVPVSAYAALAVALVGLMLLVGAFVGRPGGLIALGVVSTVALVVTSAVGAATGGAVRDEDVLAAPTRAAQVRADYSIGTGSLTVDLSGVTDVAALADRVIAVHAEAGEVRVILPPGVNADVNASVRYFGQLDVGQDSVGGYDKSLRRTLSALTPSTPSGAPTVDLELRARVGHLVVEQR